MNDTKVQRYDLDSIDACLEATDDGDLMMYDDHARIVAEKDAAIERWKRIYKGVAKHVDELAIQNAELDEKNDDLIVLVSKLEQREQELRILLAKYQRLHAADVAYDERHATRRAHDAWQGRRLAMEALKCLP